MKPENNKELADIASRIIPLAGALDFHLSAGDSDVSEILESIRSKLSEIEIAIAPSCPESVVVSDWNESAEILGLPKCRSTPGRDSKIRTRMRNKDWASSYLKALSLLKNCPFLIGKNDRGWKANIDWFLQPDSVAKILEGQYFGGQTGPNMSDLKAQRQALETQIQLHPENRDGPNYRFGQSTPDGRAALSNLRTKLNEVIQKITLNG